MHHSRRRLLSALLDSRILVAAYLTAAVAGVIAGLALAATALALAGRTLFDVAAGTAQVFLVAGPLLGLLPLSVVLLLAPARPPLLAHLPRLLALWALLAALVAFWVGIRPFLR
jgi:hypothetical protein